MSKAEKPAKKASAKSSDIAQGVDAELVRQLADLLEETGLSEIEYGRDEWHIRVSRGGAAMSVQTTAPAAAQASPAPAGDAASEGDSATEDLSSHPGAVLSPMVGVVYTSPDPDTPAFVKVGDQVNEGDTIGLVGDTGNSENPGLYFELREKGKAVDPVVYFSPKSLKNLI